MLRIGSPRIQQIADIVNGLQAEGINFKVVKPEGLSLTVAHDAEDEHTAKTVLKAFLKSVPELQGLFLSVQVVDSSGNII